MEQFPFAVDTNHHTSVETAEIIAAVSSSSSPIRVGPTTAGATATASGGGGGGADDASSLVTASSQGSFVPTSEEDGGMMHDDDIDDMDHHHDAVFANLPPPTTTTASPNNQIINNNNNIIERPPRLPSTFDPILLGATIVDLPPHPLSQQQQQHKQQSLPLTATQQRAYSISKKTTAISSSNAVTAVAPTTTTQHPSSLLSGVDALKSAGSRVTSVFSNLGYNLGIHSTTTPVVVNNNNVSSTTTTIRSSNTKSGTTSKSNTSATTTPTISNPHFVPPNNDTTTNDEAAIDFAYINVTDEDEVDIWLDDSHSNDIHSSSNNFDPTTYSGGTRRRGNVLAVLLANDTSAPIPTSSTTVTTAGVTADIPLETPAPSMSHGEQLVQFIERGNANATQAVEERKHGHLQNALNRHSDAAKFYHQAASHIRTIDESLANSLLIMSQTQAKSALSLKKIIKLRPNALTVVFPSNNNLLRERLRGALGNTPEADISASLFLGKASKPSTDQVASTSAEGAIDKGLSNPIQHSNENSDQNNLVDEMMELERELRDMDMTLTLGSSIAALDARTQNRMKSSVSESFMVVPGSASFMSGSSSMILGPAPSSTSRPYNPNIGGTAGVRARANRLQNVSRPSMHSAIPQHPLPITNPQGPSQSKYHGSTTVSPTPHSLESSWWGNASMASQILSGSVISIAPGLNGQQQHHNEQSATSTKQLMRLMDSLRILGEENATLLREVEDAEAARLEAKTAREQMKRFKEEYTKRFTALKEALEKFRKGYPGGASTNGEANPVSSSEYVKSASTSDQIQRQEQLIRKLTADLKKEKEESKRKDGALRKYESFYREVKARSAQKASQKQNQQQVGQPLRPPSVRGSIK